MGASGRLARPQVLALLRHLRREFALSWRGIHGAPHWARVRRNGLDLSARTGARRHVVELFAFLHDCRRENDGADRDHGERAAQLAHELNGRFFEIDRSEMRLLEIACRDHSVGERRGDVTVQTCWDADRLDLGRVGTCPHPDRLCTEAARDPAVIDIAYQRSIQPVHDWR